MHKYSTTIIKILVTTGNVHELCIFVGVKFVFMTNFLLLTCGFFGQRGVTGN